ncbi:MAG TPA: small ribosomal subunit Rsm22 family protein [Xanthobacteraceae bacterium]
MGADLPADLRDSLDALAQGKSRRDMARRAAAMSANYRDGGRSDAIAGADDALAYGFTRLPATYAAMTTVLAAVTEVWPELSPRSLLDAGAGPGTATFAAARQFPALGQVRLIDHNPHLRALALTLLAGSASPALRDASYAQGDLVDLLRRGAAADLVLAGYMVGELAPATLPGIADALWEKAGQLLVVVEPGTPAGFSRIRALRSHLIGRGAHVVAPCPHDGACPIVDPDWCHFSRRLNRSRDHRQVKEAALSYEDEKFSYVALARGNVALVPARPHRSAARVLTPPRVTKGAVAAKLCTPDGIVAAVIDRRDRERYKEGKAWRWGDAVACAANPEGGERRG